MRRRQLLAVGAATAALLTVAGSAAMWWRAPRDGHRLVAEARVMLSRIAEAVLEGLLPVAAPERVLALHAHLARVEATLAGMPSALQEEVDQLFTLLLSPPGRAWLLGLSSAWQQASPAELQQALASLRTSRLALRQQVFHALRDLTNAAYFADASTWAAIGYPGPRVL